MLYLQQVVKKIKSKKPNNNFQNSTRLFTKIKYKYEEKNWAVPERARRFFCEPRRFFFLT